MAVSRAQPWEGFESQESGEAGSRWSRPAHEKAGERERQRFRGWAGGRREEKEGKSPTATPASSSGEGEDSSCRAGVRAQGS